MAVATGVPTVGFQLASSETNLPDGESEKLSGFGVARPAGMRIARSVFSLSS